MSFASSSLPHAAKIAPVASEGSHSAPTKSPAARRRLGRAFMHAPTAEDRDEREAWRADPAWLTIGDDL
ncbi:MAG TPA: hypothetical protein VM580_14140 [Labilithrix sp.]|nr:hypothetical protein [Labilithrix sp.]